MLTINTHQLRLAAMAALALLTVPLALTLLNPAARLRGGEGGGFDWMPGSFLVMGLMVFCVLLGAQMLARRVPSPAMRATAIGALVVVFLLAWAELAVDGVSQVAMFLV